MTLSQMKHQLDATLYRFYFCRITLHVSGASAHHQEYLKLVQRPLVHVFCKYFCLHILLYQMAAFVLYSFLLMFLQLYISLACLASLNFNFVMHGSINQNMFLLQLTSIYYPTVFLVFFNNICKICGLLRLLKVTGRVRTLRRPKERHRSPSSSHETHCGGSTSHSLFPSPPFREIGIL